jgi:hypothetical protein
MTRTKALMTGEFHEEMRRRMKLNYNNGGKARKQLNYYFKKHNINEEFFNGQALEHDDKIKQIRDHFNIKSANTVENE